MADDDSRLTTAENVVFGITSSFLSNSAASPFEHVKLIVQLNHLKRASNKSHLPGPFESTQIFIKKYGKSYYRPRNVFQYVSEYPILKLMEKIGSSLEPLFVGETMSEAQDDDPSWLRAYWVFFSQFVFTQAILVSNTKGKREKNEKGKNKSSFFANAQSRRSHLLVHVLSIRFSLSSKRHRYV